MAADRRKNGQFRKGGPPGPGRPKGSKTRRTPEQAIVRALEDVLDETDLREAFRRLRDEHPATFAELALRAIPAAH